MLQNTILTKKPAKLKLSAKFSCNNVVFELFILVYSCSCSCRDVKSVFPDKSI